MSDVTRISDQFLSQRKDLRDVDVKSDWILILVRGYGESICPDSDLLCEYHRLKMRSPNSSKK